MAELEIYQNRGKAWGLFAKGGVGSAGGTGGGLSQAEVEKLIDDALAEFTPPEDSSDSKQVWFFDSEADVDLSKMKENDIGIVEPGTFDIFKGADGVSGFLPDYDRPQKLTGIASNGGDWPYGHYVVCPDDGWMYALCVTSTGTSTLVGRTKQLQKNEVRAGQSASAYCAAVFPVRKGDYAYASSNKALSRSEFYFYPIYKPDLTEEHVVGYYKGKPVYEIMIEFTTPSTANSPIDVYDLSSFNIEHMVSIDGIGFQKDENSQWPVNLNRGVSNIVNELHYQSNVKTLRMFTANTNWLSCRCIAKIQYVKTTD